MLKKKENKLVDAPLIFSRNVHDNSDNAIQKEKKIDAITMREAIIRIKFDRFCRDTEKFKNKTHFFMQIPPPVTKEVVEKAFREKKLVFDTIKTNLHEALIDGPKEAFENGILVLYSEGELLYSSVPWRISAYSVGEFSIKALKSKLPATSEINFEIMVVKRNSARHFSLEGSDFTDVKSIQVNQREYVDMVKQDEDLIKKMSESIKTRLKSLKSNKVAVVFAVNQHFYHTIKSAVLDNQGHCDLVVRYDSFDEESIPMRRDGSLDALLNKSILDWRHLRRWRDAPEQRRCFEPHVVEEAVRCDYVEEICIWKDLPLWRFEVENSRQDLVGVYYGNSSEIKDKYHYYEGNQRKQSEVLRMRHEEPFLDWLERHVDKYKIKFITSDLARDSDFVLTNGGLQALLSPNTNVEQLEASAPERIR